MHTAEHKSKRVGIKDYILGEGWYWRSWTECEKCGEIEFSEGLEQI